MGIRFMSLKAYQTPQHCTAFYNTIWKDFTTLKSSHSENQSMLCCRNGQVNSKIKPFTLQRKLPGVHVCINVFAGCQTTLLFFLFPVYWLLSASIKVHHSVVNVKCNLTLKNVFPLKGAAEPVFTPWHVLTMQV